MLGHPDVNIWTFNYGNALYVTQWDGQEQIHYSFYDWTDDDTTHTQLDNLEQMCWLIENKTARTDDEDINYGSKHQTNDNGLQS